MGKSPAYAHAVSLHLLPIKSTPGFHVHFQNSKIAMVKTLHIRSLLPSEYCHSGCVLHWCLLRTSPHFVRVEKWGLWSLAGRVQGNFCEKKVMVGTSCSLHLRATAELDSMSCNSWCFSSFGPRNAWIWVYIGGKRTGENQVHSHSLRLLITLTWMVKGNVSNRMLGFNFTGIIVFPHLESFMHLPSLSILLMYINKEVFHKHDQQPDWKDIGLVFLFMFIRVLCITIWYFVKTRCII